MKKVLLMVVSAVLVAALAIGITVAYLQSETTTDINVMTLGNVEIEQHEYERVVDADGNWIASTDADKYGYYPDKLQDFTQNKPLYPAVFGDGQIKWDDRANGSHQQSWAEVGAPGSNQLFDDSVANAVDKFVFVENTGKSDAYVRTVFAFEQGALTADKWDQIISTNADAAHWTWATVATDVEIGGCKYVIAVATYAGPTSNPDGVLKAGDTTYASLLQVYMNPVATNEDCVAIDGNGNGTFDIFVVSQAIQTVGFDNAAAALNAGFGEITATNHPWINGIVIEAADANELIDALKGAMKGQTIALSAGDYGYVNIDFEVADDVTILADAESDIRINFANGAVANGITVKGLDVVHFDSSSAYVDGGVITIDAGAKVDLTVSDCKAEISGGRASFIGCSEATSKITIDNCELTGGKYVVYGSAPVDELNVVNSDFSNISSWLIMLNAGDSVGANLTIDNNNFTNCTGGIAKYLGGTQPEGASTVFTNNTLVSCAGHDKSDAKWFTIPGATATVTVSGNTLDGADWTPGTAQGLGK